MLDVKRLDRGSPARKAYSATCQVAFRARKWPILLLRSVTNGKEAGDVEY